LQQVNADRALVLEFLRNGCKPCTLTSNPLAEALGGTLLEIDPAAGSAVLAFEPTAHFLQGGGVLQGGVLACMLDFAMAFAAHGALGGEERPFATATLTVHFLHPAPAAPLVARGTIRQLGRRVIFAEGELRAREAPRTLAAASALMPLG
jgi:uncharacterized protein (TIGR00369 family)